MFIDGTESEEDIAALKDMGAVLALLKVAPGVSRVHASRRVFEQLQQQQVRGGAGCKAWGDVAPTANGKRRRMFEAAGPRGTCVLHPTGA